MTVKDFEIRLYNPAGARKAIITDFLTLTYIRRVNLPGSIWFSLNGSNPILEEIQDKWIVEVRRTIDGVTWNTEIVGLFRNESWTYGANGPVFSAFCPGIKSMLYWRVNNYASGIEDITVWNDYEAETLMKDLVYWNFSSAATTANGRLRDGEISSISIESPDTAGGTSIFWQNHGKVIGEDLHDIAEIGGGDFDLVMTTPGSYEFRWYDGQLGDDISATQLFSMANGNMLNPVWSVSRSSEKTVACIWGQGDGLYRDKATVNGANYSTSNDIETYLAATDINKGNIDGLEYRGRKRLKELQAKESFSFNISQTDGNQYGIDYDLGDIVSALNPFNGTKYSNLQIKEIAVSFDDKGELKIEAKIETK